MDVSTRRILYLMSVLGVKSSDFLKRLKTGGLNIDEVIKSFEGKRTDAGLAGCNFKTAPESSFNKLVDYIESSNTDVMNISEMQYPALLKEIAYPPLILFTRGKKIAPSAPKIAVVGTRKFSHYGKDVATYISQQLSRTGITVVSGMASGIDYFAHKAALQEKGGTIGVLGCGIDEVYPPENKDLYREVIENGIIITEYLPGTPPLKQNFPARNRIISGMSMGVVVVEAGERSGALITGDFALEQDREVFSIPGSIFNHGSKGCHRLIKRGAKLVEDIDDIMEEISHFLVDYPLIKKEAEKRQDYVTWRKPVRLNADQKKIYDSIGHRPIGLEEIVYNTGLETHRVLEIISELQFEDLIIEKNLNEFIRI